MICQCGEKYHNMRGVYNHMTRGSKRVLDRDTNMRVCLTDECDNRGLMQNRCSQHGWYSAEKHGTYCPKCKEEDEVALHDHVSAIVETLHVPRPPNRFNDPRRPLG